MVLTLRGGDLGKQTNPTQRQAHLARPRYNRLTLIILIREDALRALWLFFHIPVPS